MSMIDALLYRVSQWTNRSQNDRENAEEIAFHLALEASQQAAAVDHLLPTMEDHRAARRRFGNVTYYKEELRRMGGHWVTDELWQDVSFAFRSFRRAPTFTAVAVLTLAVGIGANTAIFSAVNALLLRPLPYREPGRLMNVSLSAPTIGRFNAREDLIWSYPKFVVFRDGQRTFQDLTAWSGMQFTIRSGDEALREPGEFIDSHYFPVLGIKPVLGRTMTLDEDKPGSVRTVVIGEALWASMFHSDPNVRAKSLTVDGTAFQIIGVAPRSFVGLSGAARFWIPFAAPPVVWADMVSLPDNNFHHVIGRLKDGVLAEQAKADVKRLGATIDAAYPVRGIDVHMGAAAKELDALRVDSRLRRTVLILFGAVMLVLLIACANVANLFLVRASSRRREIATRLALGASRARIVRQLLVESLLLSTIGGIASIALALGGVKLLSTIQLASVLRLQSLAGIGAVDTASIHLDGTALLFTGALAMGTGVLFGLVPALQSTKHSLSSSIKEDSAARGRARGLTGRNSLVTFEIALAVVLLSSSGLLVRSLGHLLAVRPGFEPANLLTMRVNRDAAWSRDSISRFYDVAIQRLSNIPGVKDVGMIDCPPMEGCGGNNISFLDRPPVPQELRPPAGTHWVTPAIFSVLQTPLLQGRIFNSGDRRDTPRVVIVSDAAARQFWPGEDPIGKRIGADGAFDSATVIGVVADVHFGTMDSLPRPDVYLSYYQFPLSARMMLLVKTADDPAKKISEVRAALRQVAPGFPMYDVQPMAQRVAGALAYARFSAMLLSFFAVIALTLAALGTYGVMSFAVSQRTREIGVRSALGASHANIIKMVIGEGMLLAAAGIAIGLATALIATRLLTSLLYDVRPTDPATLAGIVVLLTAAMLGANWIPARRAVRISVVQALRAD